MEIDLELQELQDVLTAVSSTPSPLEEQPKNEHDRRSTQPAALMFRWPVYLPPVQLQRLTQRSSVSPDSIITSLPQRGLILTLGTSRIGCSGSYSRVSIRWMK